MTPHSLKGHQWNPQPATKSSAVNYTSGLNHKESEDNRKWRFFTEVKKTHLHTSPPQLGEGRQRLRLGNPNKQFRR